MDSLWGNINNEGVRTPISILYEQAEYLEKKTKNIVYAEIERNTLEEYEGENGNLVYDFLIKGSYLKNYSYKLFTITISFELYPLDIRIDTKTFEEIESSIATHMEICAKNTIKINNEKEYINLLKLILSSRKVGNLINGIISLSSIEKDKRELF